MRFLVLSLLPISLLSGCGGPSEPAAPAPAQTPEAPSAFQNQVAALTPGERNAVFIRAIRDADKDCQGVTESRLATVAVEGAPMWIARCTDGASYGIVLGRDGTAQVVSPSGR